MGAILRGCNPTVTVCNIYESCLFQIIYRPTKTVQQEKVDDFIMIIILN